MDKTLLDLYCDYLIASFGLTTATGLSTLVKGNVSHDQISRFLKKADYTSMVLWQLIKSFARQVQQEEAVLILDDSENRKVSLAAPKTNTRQFAPVSTLALEANTPLPIWLEEVDFPLLLVKQVFTNKDGSVGIVYLVTSDTTLSVEQIQTLYQKRGKVEEYHKSMKSNLCFAKSPTKTVRTQSNHSFTCLVAFVKRERLRLATSLNHFAMKAQLYKAALTASFQQLQIMQSNCPAA